MTTEFIDPTAANAAVPSQLAEKRFAQESVDPEEASVIPMTGGASS
jgi:hypothetical protein